MAGRFVSHRVEFLSRVRSMAGESIEDVAAIARANRGSPRDTRAEMTGPGAGRVGSSKPYAKAQERGAYIVPTRARALRYASGRFSKRSRLPATRWLSKAIRHWPERLALRLRQV